MSEALSGKESTIRWEQDADNIVTLILDDPQHHVSWHGGYQLQHLKFCTKLF